MDILSYAALHVNYTNIISFPQPHLEKMPMDLRLQCTCVKSITQMALIGEPEAQQFNIVFPHILFPISSQ